MSFLNVRLIIAYDGTRYLGWQKTREGPSIEAVLQQAIEQILQHQVTLQAASRTDAGVHARGQVVNFITSKTRLNLNKLEVSLNCLLPDDIAVLKVDSAEDNFHPTLDVVEKEYHYQVAFGITQMPHKRFFEWHYSHHLEIKDMVSAAKMLIGTHDFASFCNGKYVHDYEDTIRTVNDIKIIPETTKELLFIIKGSHFLYRMVRNIVGTIVYIGCKKLNLNDLTKAIANKDRKLAGMTAPAHGLTLHSIKYDHETESDYSFPAV